MPVSCGVNAEEDELIILEWLQYLLIAICIVVFAYITVRAGSIAFFRTKLEHVRRIMKEMNGGYDEEK